MPGGTSLPWTLSFCKAQGLSSSSEVTHMLIQTEPRKLGPLAMRPGTDR